MQRTAKCACERVSIEVEGDPIWVLECHCDYCQRRTGSVLQVSCWYPHDRVLVMEGETRVFRDSPNPTGVNWEFCPACGATVHWTIDDLPPIRCIAVGCFADAVFPKPAVEIFTRYRHTWVPATEGIPQHAAFPPQEVIEALMTEAARGRTD